jgi:hypothetical protein
MTAVKAARAIKETVSMAGVVEARRESDTIKLWESYRDQAHLWRALALLQIPTTLFALIFSIILWNNRQITLNVPREPLPGIYAAKDIPDAKFIEAATEYVNLIATYTPANARSQYMKARELLSEKLLMTFDGEMIGEELKAIENTGRTQIFFSEPAHSQIARANSTNVLVALDGQRVKIVSGSEMPPILTRYVVQMTTVPRNALNPYGIVITNVQTGSPDAEKKK